MPQAKQAESVQETVRVAESLTRAFTFDVPGNRLPAGAKPVIIFEGDRPSRKLPRGSCARLRTLCQGLLPGDDNSIDHFTLERAMKPPRTKVRVQLKDGRFPMEHDRKVVLAALESARFRPTFGW